MKIFRIIPRLIRGTPGIRTGPETIATAVNVHLSPCKEPVKTVSALSETRSVNNPTTKTKKMKILRIIPRLLRATQGIRTGPETVAAAICG